MLLAVGRLTVVAANGDGFARQAIGHGLHLDKIDLASRCALRGNFGQRGVDIDLVELCLRRCPEGVEVGLLVRSRRDIGGIDGKEELAGQRAVDGTRGLVEPCGQIVVGSQHDVAVAASGDGLALRQFGDGGQFVGDNGHCGIAAGINGIVVHHMNGEGGLATEHPVAGHGHGERQGEQRALVGDIGVECRHLQVLRNHVDGLRLQRRHLFGCQFIEQGRGLGSSASKQVVGIVHADGHLVPRLTVVDGRHIHAKQVACRQSGKESVVQRVALSPAAVVVHVALPQRLLIEQLHLGQRVVLASDNQATGGHRGSIGLGEYKVMAAVDTVVLIGKACPRYILQRHATAATSTADGHGNDIASTGLGQHRIVGHRQLPGVPTAHLMFSTEHYFSMSRLHKQGKQT